MKKELLAAKKDKIDKTNKMVSTVKKLLNVCKLSNFSSKENMDDFYSWYFLNRVEDTEITLFEWLNMYNETLNDDNFCRNLVYYVSVHNPNSNIGPFATLYNLYHDAFKESDKPIIVLNKLKQNFSMMRGSLCAVFDTAMSQINFNQTIPVFKTQIIGKLDEYLMDVQNHINEIIAEKSKSSAGDPDWAKLTESAASKVKDAASKAKDAAVTAKVDIKKMENTFDNVVTKKLNKLKEERKNMKHAEMVGESMRINREIKRIFKVLPIALISPAVAATIYVGSIIIDEKTEAKDRDELIRDVKLQLKILDEKIQHADREGDMKAKTKLMVEHDKLERFLFKMQTNTTEYNKIIK